MSAPKTAIPLLPKHPVLFYDGVCNFCNNTVQFVYRNDRSRSIQFAALQSDLAAAWLRPLGHDPAELSSLMYLQDGRVFKRSTAALRMAWRMGGWLRLTSVFWLVPPFIRDAVYDWVARNRYRWFGQLDACALPTSDLRARFLA